MNPKATYEITSKDKSKQGIQSAKKGVTDLGKSGVAAAAKTIAKWAAVMVSINQVTKALKKSLSLYEEQEMVEIKLAAAARNNPLINGEAFRGLTNYAAALQKTTMFGDEAILQQASFLTTLQMSEQQIKDVLQAATNLASTGMMSLESATKNLARTYSGMAGELGELIPQLRDLTAEQMKAGGAIEVIEKQYAGFAQTVAQSSGGLKQQFKNMFGDFGEDVGEVFAPLQKAILLKIKPILDALSKWLSAHSKQITNFFLHIPEIAQLSLNAIKNGFINAFSLEGIWSRLKAQLEFMKNVFVATFKYLSSWVTKTTSSWILIFGEYIKSIWNTVKAVGQTLWTPLSIGFDWVIYGAKVGWRAMIDVLASSLQWLINNPINWLGQAFYDVAHGIGEIFEFVLGGVADLINSLIDGLNKTLETSHNIRQTIAHPFNKDNREQWGGGIGNIGGGPSIDWGGEFKRFTADIIPEWKNALEPPDRHVGAEIVDVWTGYSDTMRDNWSNAFEDLGGVWEGFGGEVKTYLETIASSQMGLNKEILAPFYDELKKMQPQLSALLNEELPFEIRSVVDDLVSALDDSGKDAGKRISNAFANMVRGAEGMSGQWGEALSTWDSFNILLKMKMAQIEKSFNIFIGKIANIGINIADTFKKAGSFIVSVFTDTKNAIGKAGFAVFRNLDNIAKGLKTFGSTILYGLKSLGMGLLSLTSSFIGVLTATQVYSDVMKEFSDVINILADDVFRPLIYAVRPLIDAFVSLIKVVFNSLKPVLESIGNILSTFTPVIKALEPLFKALANVLMALMPAVQMIAQVLVNILMPIIDILTTFLNSLVGVIEKLLPVIQSILNVVMSVLQPVLNLVADLFNILAPLLQLVADALSLLAPILDAIAQVLGAILTPIFQVLGDILQAILIPVIQVLSSVLNALTPVFQTIGIIMKVITPILNVFAQLLNILVMPLQFIGELLASILIPIFQILGLVLEPLVPVFDILAKVVDAVTRPLEFLADVVTYVVDVFQTIGHNLIQFFLSLITFGFAGGDYKAMPSFESNAFSRPLGEYENTSTITLPSMEELNSGFEGGYNSTGASVSGRGASYGGQNITLNTNVTINAEAIVGEPGLREFALMIDREIGKARNLGIA